MVRASPTAPVIFASTEPLTVPLGWLDDDFATWLKNRMEDRAISQRMLALRAGVSPASVSRLLRGERVPTLSTALALLRVLGPEPLHLASRRNGQKAS